MKSFELKPTEENLLSTYKNDQIGRNTDIHAFVDILNSLEDSCSSGKTITAAKTQNFKRSFVFTTMRGKMIVMETLSYLWYTPFFNR